MSETVNFWNSYIVDQNVPQIAYSNLASVNGVRIMSDEEATSFVSKLFGFKKSKIEILHALPENELNQEGIIRKINDLDRRPLYKSSELNYIRFDCACIGYEVFNGELRFYKD